MSVTGIVRVVPAVAVLAVVALIATGVVSLDWPVLAGLAGLVVVAALVRRRLDTGARESRDQRLTEVAAAHGLEPVEPPRSRGLLGVLRAVTQGDASIRYVDPHRDSPTWEVWHAVVPTGSITCRFLAVGQRDGRPLRLSLERTSSAAGGSRGVVQTHRTRVVRSVVVATRVDVEGRAQVRPAGRAWQAVGDAVAGAFGERSQQVGDPRFDDGYALTGDTETAAALVDGSAASWWPDRVDDATVAVADGWLAAGRMVSLDAEETAATAEWLIGVVTELADRLTTTG